jgi:TBC1 domain family member 2
MILRLEDLIHRLDKELHNHFLAEGIQYIQFSFRWMNCALLRELPLASIMRLWDSYIAEGDAGFENFHVYVCAVILKMYRERLVKMEFQEILMFLQVRKW